MTALQSHDPYLKTFVTPTYRDSILNLASAYPVPSKKKMLPNNEPLTYPEQRYLKISALWFYTISSIILYVQIALGQRQISPGDIILKLTITLCHNVHCMQVKCMRPLWALIWNLFFHDFMHMYCKNLSWVWGVDRKVRPRVTVWHHEACRVMPDCDPGGRIFLRTPRTNRYLTHGQCFSLTVYVFAAIK